MRLIRPLIHPLRFAISMFAAIALAGCAPRGGNLKTEVQDLQNRLYELQKRNAEAQVEIQELRDGGGKAGSPGASGPSEPAAGGESELASSEEAIVPGSTVDLGEEGPTKSIEPAGPRPGSTSPAAPAGGEGRVEPDKLYVDGYAQFNSGNYTKAQEEFEEFLARSPESDLADDAQYWIGECQFTQKNYRPAILEFRKVIDQYPFGNRVPHAFLKVGLSYLALGERDRAVESLETVVQAFPKSEVATVAQATLDEIRKSSQH